MSDSTSPAPGRGRFRAGSCPRCGLHPDDFEAESGIAFHCDLCDLALPPAAHELRFVQWPAATW